jgi:hypothetical protein
METFRFKSFGFAIDNEQNTEKRKMKSIDAWVERAKKKKKRRSISKKELNDKIENERKRLHCPRKWLDSAVELDIRKIRSASRGGRGGRGGGGSLGLGLCLQRKCSMYIYIEESKQTQDVFSDYGANPLSFLTSIYLKQTWTTICNINNHLTRALTLTQTLTLAQTRTLRPNPP